MPSQRATPHSATQAHANPTDTQPTAPPKAKPSQPASKAKAKAKAKTKPTPKAQQAQQTKAHQRRKARAHAKVEAERQQQAAQVQGMTVCHPHAAGIDIGATQHWVCVGFTLDPDAACVRPFDTHTDGLHLIAAYLRQYQVTTVALEATGIYWIPLLELLVKEGFEVLLVDPKYTRQVRGRPKTDKLDCQWIYRLHSVGLLPGAFRPNEATCVLRNYLRQRANVVRGAARHIQHMQKALEQMNLKLTEILADITGSTGQKIIRAILKGTRDPHKLAQLRHVGCQATEAQMVQALTGSYRDEHLFALRQAYNAWQFYQKQIDELDAVIAQQLERMKRSGELPPLPKPKRRGGRKPNDPRFDVRTALYYVVGIDLTELEGLHESTALTLISEIGPDVSAFATVKQFCSWLGLCPQHKKTGGKVKSSRTRPGLTRAAQALRLAASSLHSSPSALGAYLRRMKGRLGAPQAVTATAHKLARLVYYSLKYGLAYVRQSQEQYEASLRERQIEGLKKRARQLGLEVHEKSSDQDGAAGVAGEAKS